MGNFGVDSRFFWTSGRNLSTYGREEVTAWKENRGKKTTRKG
ncbi:predicted protein [Histoplasma mississippiense (nom. inval.)]|nr:predicted protein [Histoplasma mississippiense (nom. inval.)]EDN08742.1 predicted protein [Histoplasma mississippiense (nom. inval.)]